MPTNHDVWDAIEQTDGTPGNSFEMLVNLFREDSPSTPRILPDITAVNPVFTDKARTRGTYAAKGVDRSSIYARTLVVTFDHEVVRKDGGEYIDNLADIMKAARSTGAAARRKFQVYDALGADEAFEAVFNVSVARSGTGIDDAAFKTITLSQYSEVDFITNPVLGGVQPTIDSVLPLLQGAGNTVYIEGSNFDRVVKTTASNVQFGGVDATSFQVISPSLISAVLPAGAAGPTPVRVHAPDGEVTFPYERVAAKVN